MHAKYNKFTVCEIIKLTWCIKLWSKHNTVNSVPVGKVLCKYVDLLDPLTRLFQYAPIKEIRIIPLRVGEMFYNWPDGGGGQGPTHTLGDHHYLWETRQED